MAALRTYLFEVSRLHLNPISSMMARFPRFSIAAIPARQGAFLKPDLKQFRMLHGSRGTNNIDSCVEVGSSHNGENASPSMGLHQRSISIGARRYLAGLIDS